MIWYGQYNAILVLFLLGSIVLSFLAGAVGFAIGGFVIVIILRLTATFINLICNAFFGFPLIYDTKIQLVEAREKSSKT